MFSDKIILDSDYLPDYLSVYSGYAHINNFKEKNYQNQYKHSMKKKNKKARI